MSSKDDKDLDIKLPKAVVKRIMKVNPDVSLVSTDSVQSIGKATELFLADLGKRVSNPNRKLTSRLPEYFLLLLLLFHCCMLDSVHTF